MTLEELKNMVDIEIEAIRELSKTDPQAAYVSVNSLKNTIIQLFHEFLSDVDNRFYQRQQDFGGLYDEPKDRVRQRAER